VHRAAVGATAVALAAGTFAGLGLSAGATSGFSFGPRIFGGTNRYDTAGKIAADTFPSGTSTAIIVNGFNFPDAVTAAYQAGIQGAAILLTTAVNPIPAETMAALSSLKVKNVTIVGGTSVVGADEATTLAGTPSTAAGGGNLVVNRLFGPNRYDTMQTVDTSPVPPAGVQTAILATGNDFADALSAGALSFAKHYPIILTDGHAASLTAQAASVLSTDHISHLIVTGGSAAIMPSQYNSLPGVTVDFIAAGTDRSQTAQLLADYEITTFSFSNTHFHVANGFDTNPNFPPGAPAGFSSDALAGGPNSGTEAAPTLLTLNETTTGSACTFATAHASTENTGDIFGGTAAVAAATETSLDQCAGAPATPTTTIPAPAGGLGTPPTTTAPDLVSAKIITNGFGTFAGLSVVRYTFDKPVNTSAPASLPFFSLEGFQVANVSGAPINATGTSGDPNSVDVQYGAAVNPVAFTIAVAGSSAPATACGPACGPSAVNGTTAALLPNNLGSVPLGGSTARQGFTSGITSGPDLVSANPTPGDGTNTEGDFKFDKFPAISTIADFGFYDAAGTIHRATAPVAVNSATNTATVIFGGANVTTATRWFVDQNTGVGAVVAAGSPNPEGAVTAGTGAPNPNLTGVSQTSVNTFVFTFDKPLGAPIVPANFKVYFNTNPLTSTNAAVAGSSVTQNGASAFTVVFGGVNSSNSGNVVLAAVADSAAKSTVTSLFSTVGSVPIAIAFSGTQGLTDGPDLISASRNTATSQVTFTFNAPLVSIGIPAGFFLIDNAGTPTFGIASAGILNNSATITFPAGALANAVGAGAVGPFAAQGERGVSGTAAAFGTGIIGNAPGDVTLP
jgi:putative cell wall-binding protein